MLSPASPASSALPASSASITSAASPSSAAVSASVANTLEPPLTILLRELEGNKNSTLRYYRIIIKDFIKTGSPLFFALLPQIVYGYIVGRLLGEASEDDLAASAIAFPWMSTIQYLGAGVFEPLTPCFKAAMDQKRQKAVGHHYRRGVVIALVGGVVFMLPLRFLSSFLFSALGQPPVVVDKLVAFNTWLSYGIPFVMFSALHSDLLQSQEDKPMLYFSTVARLGMELGLFYLLIPGRFLNLPRGLAAYAFANFIHAGCNVLYTGSWFLLRKQYRPYRLLNGRQWKLTWKEIKKTLLEGLPVSARIACAILSQVGIGILLNQRSKHEAIVYQSFSQMPLAFLLNVYITTGTFLKIRIPDLAYRAPQHMGPYLKVAFLLPTSLFVMSAGAGVLLRQPILDFFTHAEEFETRARLTSLNTVSLTSTIAITQGLFGVNLVGAGFLLGHKITFRPLMIVLLFSGLLGMGLAFWGSRRSALELLLGLDVGYLLAAVFMFVCANVNLTFACRDVPATNPLSWLFRASLSEEEKRGLSLCPNAVGDAEEEAQRLLTPPPEA